MWIVVIVGCVIDDCIQLLKVDEDQQVPSVEAACRQIVDRLVQTSLTAANGQSP